MSRVISFSSGKGGVGKTNLVANLGLSLAQSGKKVLLIDGDWSLGKLSILLGVRPQWTVEQVLAREVELRKAIETARPNLDLLASPTGLIGFEEMNETLRNQLYYEIDELQGEYDYILLDHASGVNWNVLQFAAASHQHVILTTPEPTSFTDAYAIMKILSKRFAIRNFFLVVTMSQHELGTQRVVVKFTEVVEKNLDVKLNLMETFSWESVVGDSVRRRQPVLEVFPKSQFAQKINGLSRRLGSHSVQSSGGLKFFFSQPEI